MQEKALREQEMYRKLQKEQAEKERIRREQEKLKYVCCVVDFIF